MKFSNAYAEARAGTSEGRACTVNSVRASVQSTDFSRAVSGGATLRFARHLPDYTR